MNLLSSNKVRGAEEHARFTKATLKAMDDLVGDHEAILSDCGPVGEGESYGRTLPYHTTEGGQKKRPLMVL